MKTAGNSSPYNADGSPRTVPGMVYVQNPRPWWVPPGLESTQGPGAKPKPYKMVSFGADREYGEEEGWQTPMSRRQRRMARRRHRAPDDEEYNFYDDAY